MAAGARIALGRIAGTYGVRGWLRVESWTRPVDNLLDYSCWQLDKPVPRAAHVLEGRVHGKGLVARIGWEDGTVLEDCELAAGLLGATVEVERTALPQAEPGTYYWEDLVGLQVRGIGQIELGRIESMLDNGAQDVMVVTDGKNRRLIPFVTGSIVERVDLDAGQLDVNWAADY